MERLARAPETLTTARLALAAPRDADADEVFERYARHRAALRYVGWKAHESLDDTRAFLAFGAVEWQRWPAGPYLVRLRETGALLGGTGLAFESEGVASTGYVLAEDAWGRGYATEALLAMVDLARALSLRRLEALCHPEHRASARVLEKGGFVLEARLRRRLRFPNLGTDELQDVLLYVLRGPAKESAALA